VFLDAVEVEEWPVRKVASEAADVLETYVPVEDGGRWNGLSEYGL
jgi:hypothetical protein